MKDFCIRDCLTNAGRPLTDCSTTCQTCVTTNVVGTTKDSSMIRATLSARPIATAIETQRSVRLRSSTIANSTNAFLADWKIGGFLKYAIDYAKLIQVVTVPHFVTSALQTGPVGPTTQIKWRPTTRIE
jgi:hypothetical protein